MGVYTIKLRLPASIMQLATLITHWSTLYIHAVCALYARNNTLYCIYCACILIVHTQLLINNASGWRRSRFSWFLMSGVSCKGAGNKDKNYLFLNRARTLVPTMPPAPARGGRVCGVLAIVQTRRRRGENTRKVVEKCIFSRFRRGFGVYKCKK